ncbi:MAG: hypothetical protein LBS10_07700 [Gracilibacteraceae bacterium]|nr:hypothetical protein [Gracilibacteraceae bacterium]
MDNNLLSRVREILKKAYGGAALSKTDCISLLSMDECSLEAGLVRAAASDIRRRMHGNAGLIIGQIGVDVKPCAGGCAFCAFAEATTGFGEYRMSREELELKTRQFSEYGDLYGLCLMTMHTYDPEHFLQVVANVRNILRPEAQIWVNVGDTSLDGFREMKAAGVYGVYHVCRLGEGAQTKFSPKDRIRTMENVKAAGLKLYTCLEPVGPEHTPEELAENIFLGVDLSADYHAAMRRVAVPGTPLASHGQISELRLAHLVAVVALTTLSVPNCHYIAVHEPNLLGCTSGANNIFAESGANPRDINPETTGSRGMDMARCRKMLFESGYRELLLGDDRTRVPLTFEYLQATYSLS